MSRLPRLAVSGYSHHVILRGNNKGNIFFQTADYERMLDLLQLHSKLCSVNIHAYVLMTNHLHLLCTPQKDGGLSQMMQSVGRTYVRAINRAHSRTGTLFEGRFRSSLIQTERYLLTCMAYIDLNPVRAGMVAQAKDYTWSSHAFYVGARTDKLITSHPLYWELGNTPFAREASYAKMVDAGVSVNQQSALTRSVLTGWALGEDQFMAQLQQKTVRRVTKSKAGRPEKPSTE